MGGTLAALYGIYIPRSESVRETARAARRGLTELS